MPHSHIFDINKRQKLNSEERRQMFMPLETLRRLGYKDGMIFADIGCGTGLFTFPASEIGGRTTKIYAVDISPDMLADVRKTAHELNYNNIETVHSDAYDFKLDDSTADFIMICTVLHEIEDKARFIAEAKRICKTLGKIAVIDFNEKALGFGPPPEMRLAKDTVRGLLADSGFSDIEIRDIGEAFYAVTGIG